MSFSDKLSIIALVVSTVSFLISYWHSRTTFIAEIKPIVVVVYDRPYTSVYEKDHLTQILDRNPFPAWKEDEIEAGEFNDA